MNGWCPALCSAATTSHEWKARYPVGAGVLFAAWDLLAWIDTMLASVALIALQVSFAKGCYNVCA